MSSEPSGDGGSAAAAARVALLALRGSIHPTMPLRQDAYAMASAPDTVLTAEALVPTFVAAAKPLRCYATVSHGVIKLHLDAPRGGTLARLAWDAAERRASLDDLGSYVADRALEAGRTLAEVPILCAARDELYECSLADVARWGGEYRLLTGGYGFDSSNNEFSADSPLYRNARARGIPYVLRFGGIPAA